MVGVFAFLNQLIRPSMDKPWLNFYENGVPARLQIPEVPLSFLLDDAISKHPSGKALCYMGKEMDYTTLGQQVRQLALALTRLGVRKGCRIAIMLPNTPQYVIAHFAILKLGAIVVPTNPLYVERELQFQLNDSGAEIIITLDLFYRRVINVWVDTQLKNVIVSRASEYLPLPLKLLYPLKSRKEGKWIKIVHRPGIHLLFDLLTEPITEDLPNVSIAPSDTAMLLYTGGTTGRPKAAVLTHENLLANTLQIRSWYVEVEEKREVFLSALPFFHSYGLTTCLHKCIFLGGKLVLIPNPRDVKGILTAIQKEKVTLFPGVPTIFVAINNFKDLDKFDLSTIKGCVSGGAPLPGAVAEQFENSTRGKLVEGYGLSEASPVTHCNPVRGKRKKGSVGIPIPNTRAKVVNVKTREELAWGEIGELAVCGPQVMQGYWKRPEDTKVTLQNGWLFTGDLAKMDEDGYFYIIDRQKDMIIAGGYNIYPREIEEILYQHPQVLEAAVVGIPDEYRGETVKAYIVCKAGQTITPDEITNFCKDKLAPFKVPKQIEFRESLPKSNVGKVLRRILKNERESGATQDEHYSG